MIDGWYWCPLPVVEKRISDMADEYDEFMGRIGVGYEFRKWEESQHLLERRLAHQCEDGSIRSPRWIQMYKRVSGGISIYGACKGCNKTLSDGIKTIILLENM